MGKNAFTMSIRPNEKQVKQALRQLAHIKHGAPRAVAAALNKTAPGVRTDTVRQLAENYTASQKDIRPAVSIGQKASPGNLLAKVLGTHHVMPLMAFRVRPKSASRRRPKGGITAEVKRGQSRKIPHAFIATIKGRPEVAQRVHRGKRVPIRRLYGPTIPQMMDNDGIAEKVMRMANARLAKNMAHEIERLHRGYGK